MNQKSIMDSIAELMAAMELAAKDISARMDQLIELMKKKDK